MKLSLSRPKGSEITTFTGSLAALPLSYAEQDFACTDQFPAGYDHDRNEQKIGKGQKVYERAKLAIQQYRHFPDRWAFAYGERLPEKGGDVAVYFHRFGLWWGNGSRVMAVIDEPRFYGFSYGTLSNHVERGEELFYTRIDADGRVYYGIQAYSQPRFWGARLLKPYARWQQARFVRDSMTHMKQLAANG